MITGENNTGKSTIGKVLFAIFNSINDMETKIEKEKNDEIYELITLLLQNYCMENELGQFFRSKCRSFARRFSADIIEYLQNENGGNIEQYIADYILNSVLFKETDVKELIADCVLKVEAIVNVSDKKVMTEVITRWFD